MKIQGLPVLQYLIFCLHRDFIYSYKNGVFVNYIY